MRRVHAILATALAISLAGCVVRGNPKAKAAIPPPPQPEPAVPAPARPPEPLSIPQTQVQLPPAQPFDADALPAVTTTETPAGGSTTTPRTNRRAGAAANPAPKPETPPAAPPVVAPPPVPEPRAPIQEIVPAAEQKRFQDSAQARKREILHWLETEGKRRLSRRQTSTVQRIRGFLKESDAAESRGDMRGADALAERAQILLRELQNGQ